MHCGEYYHSYDGSEEQRPCPSMIFLDDFGIVLQYTMTEK